MQAIHYNNRIDIKMINVVDDLVDNERNDHYSNFAFVRNVILSPYLDTQAADYEAHRKRRQIWKTAIPRFLKCICKNPDMDNTPDDEINHEQLLDKLTMNQLKSGIIKAFMAESILPDGYFKFDSSLY